VGILVIVLLFVAVVLLDTDFGTDENFAVGSDFPLYGITTQGEEFDWESFRGKYVLVKFTATWCGPCKMQIPGMRDAYNQYHDKGLEIVSVYIWDDAEAIKQFAKREKLPWTIISEPLTTKAGHPPLGETFGIQGVPTMLLVDKEGKVLATNTRDHRLKQELKKLFD
jgi:thiol-disulfide isomerase/thioredoxin